MSVQNADSVNSQAGSAAPGPSPDDPNSGDCLLGANGADVEVGIADPAPSCAQWIQNIAGTGLAWFPVSHVVLPGFAAAADGETTGATTDRLAYPDSAEELMRACWAYAIDHRPLFAAPRQQVVIGLNLHCAFALCKCTVHSSW